MKWTKNEVVYQIYPRSFKDSDGDGVGDLEGITEKLTYIQELGATAVWISPFYPSPMKDFGYDVSDYCDVDPIFGNLDNFDSLIKNAHDLKLKVMVDFVLSHTSNEHPWFEESRESRENDKRDWYTWRDPKPDGSPPNNWRSNFGGSAWTFDETTGQYYLHSFLPEQPDLNWDNNEVRSAMKDNMRFWLDRGVNGFRLDAVYGISKHSTDLDDPINTNSPLTLSEYDKYSHTYSRRGPKLFEYLKELCEVANERNDIFIVSEAYPETNGDIDEYLEFYKKIGLDNFAPFYFECMKHSWSAKEYKTAVDGLQSKIPNDKTPVYTLSNHDTSRIVSRIGEIPAKAAAVLLFSLPGFAFMYYGDELGLEDALIKKHEVRDPAELRQPGIGLGRDPSRAPMPWEGGAGGGFTTGEPWLPLAKSLQSKNVESESLKSESMLSLYKTLISLRKKFKALSEGEYVIFDTDPEKDNLLMFGRKYGEEIATVLVNFSATDRVSVQESDILLSTVERPKVGTLAPLEARIIMTK